MVDVEAVEMVVVEVEEDHLQEEGKFLVDIAMSNVFIRQWSMDMVVCLLELLQLVTATFLCGFVYFASYSHALIVDTLCFSFTNHQPVNLIYVISIITLLLQWS